MRYIYLHPLFDERKSSHRFSYQLKESFAEKGIILERFDYRGTGESQGKFSDISMESLLDDLMHNISTDKVCLIGTRFGGSMALQYSCIPNTRVDKMILIEPIIDGSQYVKYLLKKQRLKDVMTGGGAFLSEIEEYCNIEGYKTRSGFIEQIEQFHIQKIMKSISVKNSFYIVQVTPFSKIKNEYSKIYGELLKENIPVTIENCKLLCFWERIPATDYSVLTNSIVEWCYV